MPHPDPYGDINSEVPDGFEFLHTEAPNDTIAANSVTSRAIHPLLWVAVVVGIAMVASLIAFEVLRDQPAPSRTSPPAGVPSATASNSSRSPEQQSRSATPTPREGSAMEVLAQLEVKGRAPTTGYERERFGPDWADVDDNGCDTRNDVLDRDLTTIATDPDDACLVETGLLADPYSGRQIDFTRGWETSFAVQIDHVVALSNAWQTGAQYWEPGKRLRFANDPLNLLAVDGELNLQKGDGDAATWLPPLKAYRCEYVARQIAVKAKYRLWLTFSEHDAMARILSACPEQPLPASSPR